MNKEKQIQIPMPLFGQMVKYFLIDHADDQSAEAAAIRKGIENKIDATVRHDLYTKYKTAPTEEQREAARQEYLQQIGIKDSFRW